MRGRYRPGVDVSLPTPWTEDVARYAVRHGGGAGGGGGRFAGGRAYFLTFKGNMATSRPYGDVRRRARAALHDPRSGVVVVDSRASAASGDEGASYDYRALMYDTVFTLILRGDQPYSYRYTEAVCSGAVPVLVLSDGWVPPFEDASPFPTYGVLAAPEELGNLTARLRGLGGEEVEALRLAAKRVCMQRLVTVHAQASALVERVLANARA
jgi:hypothetical protein